MIPVLRDIIVLGAGPAGVSALDVLLNAGKTVSLISSDLGLDLPGPVAKKQDSQLDTSGVSPKVLDIVGANNISAYLSTNRLQSYRFQITGQLRDGGLSNAWGAVAPRWSNAELAGFGDEIQLVKEQYDHIAPEHQLLSEEVVTERWRRAIRCSKGRPDTLSLSPNMVDFGSYAGQPGFLSKCKLCSECFKGCKFGSIYDAGLHLKTLLKNPSLERLSTGSVVKIEADAAGKPLITCIEGDGSTRKFLANRLIVALGAIASTRLLAPLLPRSLWPQSMQTTPSFVVPLFDRHIFTREGTPEFALAQVVFDLLDANGASESFGSIYSSRTIPLDHLTGNSVLARLGASAGLIKPLLAYIDIALGFLPGRYSNNSLTFDQNVSRTRAHGMTVTSHDNDLIPKLVSEAIQRLRRLLSTAAIHPIARLARILPAGADTHYGASLRPGKQTTLTGCLVNHPRIYCVDGAVLPELPAKHPTLTIMANARRIANNIIMSRS